MNPSHTTTILGVLTIIGALANAGISYFSTGTIDWTILGTGITAGVGLIFAKDAKITGPSKP